jgi:histidine ammonia-lyase
VLAIELHCAFEALGFRTERPGVGTRKVLNRLRESIAPLHGDRPLSKDIDTVVELMRSNAFAGVLEE